MSQIGGNALFATGGHRWTWGRRPRPRKVVTTTRASGAAAVTFAAGGRPGRIRGRLIGTGETRAEADTALDALEAAIEALADTGLAQSWTDDQGHSGDQLVVLDYVRRGRRTYTHTGATFGAWQTFEVPVLELAGGPTY